MEAIDQESGSTWQKVQAADGVDKQSLAALEVEESLVSKAQNGDEDAQLDLGRRYRSKAETSEDPEDGALNAVYWLVKASRQGNDEATELLQQCVEKQLGVNEENLSEVTWCLKTPKLEKCARQAAKSLFYTINPLGGASLGKEDYKEGINKVASTKNEAKLLEKAAKKLQSGAEISEDEFIDKVWKRLSGVGGIISTQSATSEVEMEAFNTSSWYQKVTRYPGKLLEVLVDQTVDIVGKQGMTWLRSIIPTHQIHMLIIFFIYSVLSAQIILWFLPLMVFYISVFSMVICTMQMFYSKRKLKDVKAMAGLLKRFNQTLDSDSAESSFTWNSMKPYMAFFVSLLFCISSFSLSDKGWIPMSELACIAAFFTLSCFLALSDQYDFLAFLSIFFDILSTLPTFYAGFPQIPVLYQLVGVFAGSVISIELVPGMYLNIGLPSLAYLVVPLLFIRMAFKHSYQGTYRVLIPHLVCFFWWQIAVMFYHYSSWSGLLRATFGWISFIILLPVISVFFILGAVIYVWKIFSFASLWKLCMTVILLGIPVTFGLWAKAGFKFKGFSLDENSRRAKMVLVFLFLLSVIPMVYFISPPEYKIRGEYLTWEQYRGLCSKPQWDKTNIADSMVKCSQLKHTMVDWTGTVKKIVVKDIINQADSLLSKLPFVLSDMIMCTYGDPYPDCSTLEEGDDRKICELATLQGRPCHMNRLNHYLFEIWVQMPISETEVHDVRITASHWFMDTLFQIKDGETVNVRASLKGELGNTWPELRLYSIRCTSCDGDVAFSSKSNIMVDTWGIVNRLKCAVFDTFNFFIAPVIELKTAGEGHEQTVE